MTCRGNSRPLKRGRGGVKAPCGCGALRICDEAPRRSLRLPRSRKARRLDRTLRLLHGNRLDALAARMADAIAAEPPADPLAPEWIVVPHPGMGRWLQQFLAQRWGIAACLELVLPGKFLWDVAKTVEGTLPAQSAYERDALEWRIYGALRDARGRAARAPALMRYLGDGDPLKAFELAQRVADAFDQYLVYRPGWLERWERGESAVSHPHEAWQAELWRAVRAGVGEPHRAEVLRAVAARLERDPSAAARLPPRVSVFGVSAMPARHVELFAALARRTELTWYQLNPSTEWWGDVVTARERARIVAKLAVQGVAEEAGHLDDAHPLLAAWGKVGRDTLHALYANPLEDEVLPSDAAPAEQQAPGTMGDLFAPPPARRPGRSLDWLKATIDTLDPKLPPPAALDDSIRMHACASRVREVEVLHDRLLAWFERDATLTPRDVVVMTPKLAEYAPLVEAVFGAAPESRRIPVTVADRPARDAHALLRAFGALLALPQSRLTASEVLDLLGVDAIARRFELAHEAGEHVAAWIEALGIRWGLDADDRERAGVGRWGDFAWRQGLDRLVLGYAMGATHDSIEAPREGITVGGAAAPTARRHLRSVPPSGLPPLPQNAGRELEPYPWIEGQRAATAGRLVRFVERLADWRVRLAAPRTAQAWQETLTALVGELVDTRASDANEAVALKTIYAAIGAVVDAAARGGQASLALPHAVARAAVDAHLAEPDRHQRFLAAGTTVCAMVPMRNVPFRIVCLLGLDDGEFPRREPEPSFHLVRAYPQPGDRTRQDDDRYLFLEALLAARESLHVSYVAVNPRDGSLRPPSIVVSELLDFVAGAYGDDARKVRDLVHVVHAASAYEPAVFVTDGREQSFDDAWLPAAAAAAGPRVDPPHFAELAVDDVAPAEFAEIALDEVVAFYRDPAKHYVRRVLELALPDLEATVDDEPQALDGLGRYAVDDALLRRLLVDPRADDDALVAMLRARALLRPGRGGVLDAKARLRCVRELVGHYRKRFGAAAARVVPVERRTDTWRVAGEITVVGDAVVTLRAGGARGGDWIALALQAQLAGLGDGWLLGIEEDAPCVSRLDARALDPHWIDTAVAFYRSSRHGFVPLIRQTSWAWAKHGLADPAKAASAARQMLGMAVRGRRDARPEIDEPHVALLLRGRDEPFDEAFAAAAQALLVPLRAAIEEDAA